MVLILFLQRVRPAKVIRKPNFHIFDSRPRESYSTKVRCCRCRRCDHHVLDTDVDNIVAKIHYAPANTHTACCVHSGSTGPN